MQQFLRLLIPVQPPGYSQGINYLGKKFRRGLFKLQSQMLEGNVTPSMNSDQWTIAPKMITSLKNINDEIYLILPKRSQPILGGTHIDPGSTASTRVLERALTTYYGYSKRRRKRVSRQVGKTRLAKYSLTWRTFNFPPGVIKNILRIFGGHPISSLPQLLAGNLTVGPNSLSED